MTKNWFKSKKTFILIFLSLLLVACLIVANYISLYIIKADTKTEIVSNSELTLYMLSLSKSKVENEAKAIAPDFQEIGAGGYIWKHDDYYHVVSSAYINKNDAELVKNSIKINQNLDSEIFSVKFKPASVSGSFTGEEKKVVIKTLSIAQILYSSIYDISVSLDTGVYNELSAKLAVNSTANEISTTYANYNTLYPSQVTSPLQQIGQFAKSIVKISGELASDTRNSTAQTYSSHLKYKYLEALSLYYEFLQT